MQRALRGKRRQRERHALTQLSQHHAPLLVDVHKDNNVSQQGEYSDGEHEEYSVSGDDTRNTMVYQIYDDDNDDDMHFHTNESTSIDYWQGEEEELVTTLKYLRNASKIKGNPSLFLHNSNIRSSNNDRAGALSRKATAYLLEKSSNSTAASAAKNNSSNRNSSYSSPTSTSITPSQSVLYDDNSGALVYAITRLPACYAAIKHALLQIKHAAPVDWYPKTMLDFGAGPGTSTWAAWEVWKERQESPMHVSAVEPSVAMSGLGYHVQEYMRDKALHQGRISSSASNHTPVVDGVDDVSTMDQLSSNGSMREEQKGIDTGGLLAGHRRDTTTTTTFPRIRWTSRLPLLSSSTTTSKHGKGNSKHRPKPTATKQHDLVVAAYVFSEIYDPSARKRVLSTLWESASQYLVIVEPGTPSGFSNIADARKHLLGLSKSENNDDNAIKNGALPSKSNVNDLHILAPCPHDGHCPLEHRKAWCHFVQKFERTDDQRRAKAFLSSIGIQSSSTSATSARAHQDERFSYVIFARGPRSTRRGGEDEDEDIRIAGAFKEHAPEVQEESQDSVVLQGSLRSVDVGIEKDGMRQNEEEEDGAVFTTHDDDSDDKEHGYNGDDDVTDKRLVAREIKALLQQSIASLPSEYAAIDDEDDEKSFLEDLDEEELYDLLQDMMHGNGMHGDGSSSGAKVKYSSTMHFDEDELYGIHTEDAEKKARTSSQSWSRIIRSPRKRSGHVLIDVCSAVDEHGESLGGGRGTILRQVVSKGASKTWVGGTAPYRLARRARWGDVWPMHYQRMLGGVTEAPAMSETEDGVDVGVL